MKYRTESSFWNNKKNIKWFKEYPPSNYWISFLRLIKGESQKKVLDLGCGAGRHTKILHELGFRVYACDRYLNMVRQTQSIMSMNGWNYRKTKKQIIKGNMDNLPYQSGYFDLIICHGVYHNAFSINCYKKSIAESSRILKPGGFLLFNIFTDEFLAKDIKIVKGNESLYLTKENLRMLLVSPNDFLDIASKNSLFPLSSKNLIRYSSLVSTGKRSVFRGILVKK